ncbi:MULTISPECIES: DUF2264 domain-containing protein [unclassified Actinopolyspora]|uniref:DUF2264 domain-containing protein n=1 Tax=unclassified Actinopolyspora TaxID=2639451 RepID=UPI0013F5DBA7|nr:DUF2264 domain-containing protein [Actinopolyspora sp. BKK2]NHE78530.1 DUF2264 domain-containing protein [Actinopolyspora sp. BKK1]
MTPEKNCELSPCTGWTRQHWASTADGLLRAVQWYRSPAGARFDLPGPVSANGASADGLEGFARTFLLQGFRVVGEQGRDPTGLLERYAEGLAAGTDPASPERWPRPDELGQAKVEAASIALILQVTRPWLWDELDDRVRGRVVDWLSTVVGQQYPPINWVWFRVVVESFLREVGGPWSAADIEEDLAVHAALRRGEGWYSDGQERAFDHYVGWALHLYPMLWTHWFDVVGSLCPVGTYRTWAADLARYLDDAVHLVGADGSPLMQGRSLVYRFAAAAPFWVGALTGHGGLSPGLVRRVCSGVLRHFTDRGVPDADGLLNLGWHGAWPGMRQAYSGAGSPYWASKGMLGLALPAHHPVWNAVEEPLPSETSDHGRVVSPPGWLVSHRRADGVSIVLNHGTDHAEPGARRSDSALYARLGYSTATVPPLIGSTVADPVDNAVAIVDAEGAATHRTGFERLYAREADGGALAAASRGRACWVDAREDTTADHGYGRRGAVVEGPVVTVASVLRAGLEVRLVRVDPAGWEEPGAGCFVRMGGWPVASDGEPAARGGPRQRRVSFASAALRSLVSGVRGFTGCGLAAQEGTTPLGAWTAVPWLATDGVPAGEVLAGSVLLDRGGREPVDPAVLVRPDGEGGHQVTVAWPDGEGTTVELPGVP